jgi:hypothetical protein
MRGPPALGAVAGLLGAADATGLGLGVDTDDDAPSDFVRLSLVDDPLEVALSLAPGSVVGLAVDDSVDGADGASLATAEAAGLAGDPVCALPGAAVPMALAAAPGVAASPPSAAQALPETTAIPRATATPMATGRPRRFRGARDMDFLRVGVMKLGRPY